MERLSFLKARSSYAFVSGAIAFGLMLRGGIDPETAQATGKEGADLVYATVTTACMAWAYIERLIGKKKIVLREQSP